MIQKGGFCRSSDKGKLLLAKFDFCGKEEFPDFFHHPPLHPSLGGADFHGKIVVLPTGSFSNSNNV